MAVKASPIACRTGYLRDDDCPRSSERLTEPSAHDKVGVRCRLRETASAKHKTKLMLQAPELALDGGAATLEHPLVRAVRDLDSGAILPLRSGDDRRDAAVASQ